MVITSLICLDLRAPLSYKKIDCRESDVSEIHPDLPENEEILLCYEINPAQSGNIEPDREQFLGSLAFFGKKADDETSEEINIIKTAVLPAGNYLFNQCRAEKTLNKDEWLDIAIEQQKDGLWERQKLKDLLYIRFLCEDSSYVTQVFRPIIKN